MNRGKNVDRFYELLDDLEETLGHRRTLSTCTSRDGWPRRGVYFFFEPGEVRADGRTPRVVRVGTHALTAGNTTLWNRLSAHRGSVGGSMPGGGNHRGSIFRLHVGTALLATGEWPEEIHRTWGRKSSASRAVREAEYPLEQAVSRYVGAMPFLWLDVPDEPGPRNRRATIESGAISLLSNHAREAIDPPSPTWLGHSADRDLVRSSGLWNVNHTTDPATSGFLDDIEELVSYP